MTVASSGKRMIRIGPGWEKLVIVLLCLAPGCGKASINGNENSNDSFNRDSATMPYSTKEPKTYQATFVSSTEFKGESNPLAGLIQSTKRERFVARDGAQQRIDFDLKPGIRISYLQNLEGKYILLPSKKLYANVEQSTPPISSELSGQIPVNPVAGHSEPARLTTIWAKKTFSAEKLRNTA